MSKILHNPTLQEVIALAKSAPQETHADKMKRFKKLPEIKSGYGVDNIEKLYVSNIIDELAHFNVQ